MSQRVLVCGGRDFDDHDRIHAVLSWIIRPATLVHGDARGADRLAATCWMSHYDGVAEPHPADWRGQGRIAGIIRNRLMLDLGADWVIAFPGGTGTANMVSIALKAGVRVMLG